MPLEEKIFFQGANADDEVRSIPQGDYLLAGTKNIRIYDNNGQNMAKVVNIKGTTLVHFQLPAGRNVCIGARSDTDTGKVFYAIFNDLLNHGIYLFDPTTKTIETVLQDPILGFTEFNRINHMSLVGQKLLYWTDGGISKKINIIKSTENKVRIYNAYFGLRSGTGETYHFVVKDPSKSTVFTWNSPAVPLPPPGTAADGFYVSHYLSTVFPANAYISILPTGAFLSVTMKNLGKYTLVITSNRGNQVIAVAQNFYPSPISFDIIDRLKYPPHFQPTASYKIDTHRDTNYVQNRIFQFAVQYVYDDDEPSTLSPISVIPDFGAQCTQSIQQSLYNYIEVDFTGDGRLNNLVSRSIIQYVNVYFREGNTGKFQLIKTLQQYEFGIGKNVLNFYNDGIYQVLDDATAATLFSAVPITNGAQEFIGNHLVDGDIVEGYDNVNIDAELKVDYAQPILNVYDIKGTVRIINNADPHNPLYPPLFFFTGATNNPNGVTMFGGFQPQPFGSYGVTDHLDTRYFQTNPLGGFVFYLAGTDYYGISKQKYTGTPCQDSVTGLCNISSQVHMIEVRNIINAGGGVNGFTSEWVIKGVPPGVYSLRVASHLTTAADLTSSDREYQRRSTTVFANGLLHQSGVLGSGKTEAIVEILQDGTINLRDPDSFNIYASNYSGNFTTLVQDISQGPATPVNVIQGDGKTITNCADTNGLIGYLVDSETQAVPASFDLMLSTHERVTRAVVKIAYIDTGHLGHIVQTVSDHNGFFYDSRTGVSFGATLLEYQLQEVDIGNLPPDLTNTMYNFDTFPATFTVLSAATQQVSYGIRYFSNKNLTDNGRTFIDGIVKDVNGNAVSGVTVVIPYHGAEVTDSFGKYSISFYDYVSGNNVLILASPSALCSYDISVIPQVIIGLLIGASNYNNLVHKIATDLLASLTAGTALDAFKRGGNWQMGIVYYDRGLRSGTVNNTEKTNLSVVFYTEKDPNTGLIPNKGEPSVSWKVRNLPPAWATHWQWVRTSNLALSYYLQWIANTIDYVDLPSATAPVVPYALANYLRIDLSNIKSYSDINKSSLVGYTWSKGDRIRFISDPNGNYFNQYFDYEIVYQDSTAIFVVRDLSLAEFKGGGAVFEIYTPRLNVNNKIYYEMGEEFEVGVSRGIPFHKGLTTDQDPANPYNSPATGTFRTGDAWYRKRQIPYLPYGHSAPVRNVIVVDDQSVSDFYASKDDNIGRINILDINAQQVRREKTLLPSGVYIQQTKINLLSWVISNDAVDIEKGEGRITKLQTVGRILLAYQPSSINSVYIREIQYVDSSGNKTLTRSDSFIGTVNPLELLTGTVNPESVFAIEGRAYHYDRMNGMFGRYATNGLFPISKYKIASFAWNKAKEMSAVNNDGIYALGFINPSSGEYGVSFVDRKNTVPLIKQETISFVESPNRWTTEYDHLAEQYAYSNGTMIGIKNGQLWLHDTNSIRNNFYGVQYSSKLTFVSNQNNSKMRIFLALVIDGSDLWYCPDDDSIIIPPSSAYPNGMASRLQKTAFRRVGTDWYAPFKKDLNTPNKPSVLEALVNGRDLTGHAIVIRLQNDSTEEVSLKSASVRYILQEFTKK